MVWMPPYIAVRNLLSTISMDYTNYKQKETKQNWLRRSSQLNKTNVFFLTQDELKSADETTIYII
jgi:uncharacterized protein (DUF1919 family)